MLGQREHAAISVYAQGRDYHEVMKTRLKALGRFIWDTYRHDLKVFVDTAPLMEKPAAQAAGHGWQGKHTNLVSRQFGSWLFLGELLLSAELPFDAPESDHCGQCRACLDACPTDAFPAPYQLDARRCISYLTIEHEGADRSASCGRCSATASMAATTASPPARGTSSPRRRARRPSCRAPSSPRRLLAELATLDDAAFRRRFAGTAIKRIGRDRFVRNVAYALGNSGAPSTALPASSALAGATRRLWCATPRAGRRPRLTASP